MYLPAFALDDWLDHYKFSDLPIEHDLASSTGPSWTFEELLRLVDFKAEKAELFRTKLVYAPASGGEKLRAAIGEMQAVDPNNVLVITGASEALLILLFLAAEPGANVIVPAPCFPPIRVLAQSFGLETRFYHLRPERRFCVDLSEVKGLADDRTKLLLVNSPHNPTGATLSNDELRLLYDFAAKHGIQFVSDEVYHPIYHGSETESAAHLPHATVIGSFSKALSLSGLRVGWIIERNEQRVLRYLTARQYFTISNSALSIALAEIAVLHRQTLLARAQQMASSNLALLDEFFAEHSDRLGWVRPRGGTVGFPWLTDGSDARPFCQALAERGVLLAPGDCFDMPSYFRLGFGASKRFGEALERFADFLRDGRVGVNYFPLKK